jgi:hypothetical protein
MSDVSSDDNGWNDRVEEQVANLGNLSLGYQWIHTQTSKFYANKHKKLVWCNVLAPNIAGLSVIITIVEKSNPENSVYYQVVSIVFSFIAALFSIIVEFGDYGGKAEEEKRAAHKYMGIGGNIQRQLNRYRNERQNGADYIGWISGSFEDLQEASPLLNDSILVKYAEISRDTGIVVPEAANMVIPMKFGLKRKKTIPSRIAAPSIASSFNVKERKVSDILTSLQNSAKRAREKVTTPDKISMTWDNALSGGNPSSVSGGNSSSVSGVFTETESVKKQPIEWLDIEMGCGYDEDIIDVPAESRDQVGGNDETYVGKVVKTVAFDDRRMMYEMSRLNQHSETVSERSAN